MKAYLLLVDFDGTLNSNGPVSMGVCVQTKEEAERFVLNGLIGYERCYEELTIYPTFDDALDNHKGWWTE